MAEELTCIELLTSYQDVNEPKEFSGNLILRPQLQTSDFGVSKHL